MNYFWKKCPRENNESSLSICFLLEVTLQGNNLRQQQSLIVNRQQKSVKPEKDKYN